MINQDDNTGLKEQLNSSLVFLTQSEEQTQKELDYLYLHVKNLEERLLQIDTNMSLSSKLVETNSDLFSPSRKNEKQSLNHILNNEKALISKQIEEAKADLLLYNHRKKDIINSINCLKELQIINCGDEHTNGKITDDKNEIIDREKTVMGINMLETQENERKRIARDLHDSTIQNLTTMVHKTELCTKLIDIDPIRTKLELQTMIHTIKMTIDGMRDIIYNLRPMSIDDLGLIDTIERHIRNLDKINEVDISLNVINDEIDVLPVIRLTLFRIVQEALNNAIKHGKVTKIAIELEYNNELIFLTISDDGIGFIEEKCKSNETNVTSGFGLSIMKERVLLLSGEISIESNDNKGTKISIKIPIRNMGRIDNGTN